MSSVGRIDSSLPAQPAPPSVSAEAEVSKAAGEEGGAVLRGGGAGMVENQMSVDVGVEQEAVGASRDGQRVIRDARFEAGDARMSATGAPLDELERAENLGAAERGQVVVTAQAAEDADAQARRIADDPSAAGTERARREASRRAGESLPFDRDRVEGQANLATGAVADPEAAAGAQVQASVSAEERKAEAELGIRGPEGKSREEIAGSPPSGDGEKK